jgi:14-3-3 protein epsilon
MAAFSDAEDRCVLLARVAERMERYDEMADYMRDRAVKPIPLSVEEREMLSAAFKNAISGRRHAVRVVAAVEANMDSRGEASHSALARGYRSKVAAELQGVCDKAITLLKNNLLPTAADAESKTFYLKMMADYHRYVAEFAEGELRRRAADEARVAYTQGTSEAASLGATHPVALGLALNFSVFQHEVLGETANAVATAQAALTAGTADLQRMPEDDSRQDAITSLQLLQENLMLWEPALAAGQA